VIPPRSDVRLVDTLTVTPIGEGRVQYIVDGNEEKLATIADAIAWVWRRMPRADALDLIAIEDEGPDVPPALQAGEKMRFAAGTAGRAALEQGWDNRGMGHMVVAKRAILRFSVNAVSPSRLWLGYCAFVHGRRPSINVVCRSNGDVMGAWKCAECRRRRSRSLQCCGWVIELEFKISDPQFARHRLLGLA